MSFSQSLITDAAKELLRRRKAVGSLVNFAQAIDIPGKPVSEDPDEWLFNPVETDLAKHHVLMLEVMEWVITGKRPEGARYLLTECEKAPRRAMFFLPPGSAKSSYGSVVAPTWAMGKFPGEKIILASYGSDLARKHGRRARQIAKSKAYQSIFQTKISSETSAADEWALTTGSEYLACGILSGITGNRAHGLIIDDPVKGRQDADSETVQQRTKDVYEEDLLTRLIPGGWVMIIQTRWNELDLSGGILPEDYEGESGLIHCRDGNDWYVVCLPAQCERNDDPLGRKPGEFLWPEWFSEEHFKPFMINTRTWNALFQQRPQPETGTFFQREWFHRYNPKQKPNNLYIYGSSDYAVTDDAGDFTEHGVVGVDPDNNIWILDWWHGQTTADIWFESLLDLIAIHKPFCWFGEAGVIKRAIEPFLERRMIERMVYCRHEWLPSIADKPTRARGFQARASQGKIYIPEGETGDRIIDQCLRFPTGSHDDAVDVLSLFCRALDQAHPAIAPRVKKEVPAAQKHIEQIMKGTSRGYEEAVLREQHMQNVMLNREKSRSEGRAYSDVDGR